MDVVRASESTGALFCEGDIRKTRKYKLKETEYLLQISTICQKELVNKR